MNIIVIINHSTSITISSRIIAVIVRLNVIVNIWRTALRS